jgi:translation initiation factor IF-3
LRGGSIPREERQRVNEEIRAPQVRLIDSDGRQVGVVPLREALNAAREQTLDLVEVAPGANPPVCKILDYGKYQYTQMKRQREARKGQRTVEIKEIRLRPKTGDYHIAFKLRRARRFLGEGNKVKVRIQFRGREITYPEIALQQLREVASELADVADVEQRPDLDGRSMLMVLAPKKTAADATPS